MSNLVVQEDDSIIVQFRSRSAAEAVGHILIFIMTAS